MSETPRIAEQYLYPVKGLRPFVLEEGDEYPITRTGPQYDHEWMPVIRSSDGAHCEVYDSAHRALLETIRMEWNREAARLTLCAKGLGDVSLSLEKPTGKQRVEVARVHGDRVKGLVEPDGSKWLTELLGREAFLLRRSLQYVFNWFHVRDRATQRLFVNRAQLIMVSRASLQALNEAREAYWGAWMQETDSDRRSRACSETQYRTEDARYRSYRDPLEPTDFGAHLVLDNCSMLDENRFQRMRLGSQVELEGIRPNDARSVFSVPSSVAGRFPHQGYLPFTAHAQDSWPETPLNYPIHTWPVFKGIARQILGGQSHVVPIFGEECVVKKPGTLQIGDSVEFLQRHTEEVRRYPF